MKIVFATNNEHKLKELQQLIGEKINLLSLRDIDCNEDIPETKDTLEENALEKAEYVFRHYNMDCFADDTGLEIEALDGKPGVFSARYAGEEKNMEKNIDKILDELKYHKNRNARFKTVISLILDGEIHQFIGIVNGKIIDERRGVKGFGYDPVFVPGGYSTSFAEMSPHEKNKISHRGQAVKKLVGFLNKKTKQLKSEN